jgi:hypothetical protein
VVEVPNQICRLNKHLQMDFFLKLAQAGEGYGGAREEGGEGVWRAIRSLVNLYCVTHEVAGGRGVGGLREVQPGDELLLLASTALKRLLLTQRDRATRSNCPEVRECPPPSSHRSVDPQQCSRG